MTTPAAGAKTNVLAIVSLVTSIIGLSLVGVITGHVAMNQIKKTGEEGNGLAIAGLVIGYIGLAAFVIWIFAFGGLLLLGAVGSSTSMS